MRKQCSNICKFHPCLATESTNLARMHTIVTTALQRQYLQTELIIWITLLYYSMLYIFILHICVLHFYVFVEMNVVYMLNM